MFKLELCDSKGKTLNPGDIVRVFSGRSGTSTFYSEVKYLEKDNVIAPFHTFSFHHFEKVDKVPENAHKLSEDRYNIWFNSNDSEEPKEAIEQAQKYLIDWRACEHLLQSRCFKIKLL